MNQAQFYVNWCITFQARVEGQRHHHYENILRYVQKAPNDIRCQVDRNKFDEPMVVKKESAPSPDGNSYGHNRFVGGLGSKFHNNAYKHALDGGTVPGEKHRTRPGAARDRRSQEIAEGSPLGGTRSPEHSVEAMEKVSQTSQKKRWLGGTTKRQQPCGKSGLKPSREPTEQQHSTVHRFL